MGQYNLGGPLGDICKGQAASFSRMKYLESKSTPPNWPIGAHRLMAYARYPDAQGAGYFWLSLGTKLLVISGSIQANTHTWLGLGKDH